MAKQNTESILTEALRVTGGDRQENYGELASDTGIPISQLVISFKGNTASFQQGTWIHPDVAIHLGQWCSPKFAVAVARWVRDWMSGKAGKTKLPYHIERYMANRSKIPHTHFSILNEMIFGLEWLPKRAIEYFTTRDPKALPYLKKLLPPVKFKQLTN